MIELYKWSCIKYGSDSPDLDKPGLIASGIVFDDPRFPVGTFVITSRIVSAQERTLVTENGSHYILVGDPCVHWFQWCLEEGVYPNLKAPLARNKYYSS